MSLKTMFIVNPVSGKGHIKNYLLSILEVIGKGGEPVTVYVTEKHGDATEYAAQYGAEYDRLIVNGGDGTLNEVMNGLMRLPEDKRPMVGYIPLGTTNDMASSFNLPKTTEEVIEHLSYSNCRYLDVGQFQDNYFGYVSAFGAFTDIPFTTPQEAKNTWGYLAYIISALGSIQNIRPIHTRITCDEGNIEDEFVLGAVVNSTSVAGIIKLPAESVSLDDGIFEVLLIKNPRNAMELNSIVTGILSQDFSAEGVTLLHTREITFDFDEPVVWTCDGENGGTHQHVTAKNHRRALRLML